MSTIRGKLAEYLTKCGLDPDVADEIINTYRAYDECRDVKFEDATEGYPPQLLAALKYGVRQEAVKWIDANQPKHFARAFFVSTRKPSV
jgi:hypothetical protein